MRTHQMSVLRSVLVGLAVTAAGMLISACSSSNEQVPVVSVPTIPGATFVGSKECAACHSEKLSNFEHATHARLSVNSPDGKDLGSCEACHGPASLHVSAGDGKNIINPDKDPETCFRCHQDKKGQFSLPHSHQVLNGRMTCTDCHEMHAGNAIKGSGARSLETESESCTRCHTAQKGPYVMKHQAMREGCTACHNPHGSINQKMLVQRDSNLCLKCHFEMAAPDTITAGTENHRTRMQAGNCWVTGCHEAVHGSNASKALRY